MKKIILFVLGLIALLFGTIGIFLPVLPTTPLVLLSVGCFSVSSPRLSSLLKRNQYFGSYIENYHNKTGVPRKIKYHSIIFLWAGLIISMLIAKTLMMIILLMVVGIGVTIHLATFKIRE